MLVDTHFHLSNEDYDNIDLIIKEAIDNKVTTLIMSGCDKKSIIEGLEYIKEYDNLYMTVGFHPEEVDSISDKDLTWLEEIIINNKKIVGIGEIGLDYYYTKDNKDLQIKLFRNQLDIAKRLNLPVVIHSRDAFLDTYNTLKEYNVVGVIHCFTSNIENARKFIKLGFKLGIGGVVTFKNSKLGEVIKNINLKNIVLETDSPYLSPEPFRGKKNGPKNVLIVAKKIAELKEINIDEVMRVTTKNAYGLFDLNKVI